MFPNLPARRPTGLEAAKEFGLPDGRMDGSQTDDDQENPALPAGFTYLGQFIDHDLTLDVFSELGRNAESGRLTDFRTPRLDMDNLYGVGPTVSPHLYDPDSRDTKLALSEDGDLARTGQGVALIGDPRNDENLIPAQFHLALIKFHYRVVDALRAGEINDALGRPLPPPDDPTPRTDLRGGAVLPEHALNWTFFFPVRSDRRHQSAKRITSVLDSQLLDLPVSAVPGRRTERWPGPWRRSWSATCCAVRPSGCPPGRTSHARSAESR